MTRGEQETEDTYCSPEQPVVSKVSLPTKLLFPHLQSMHIKNVALDGHTVTLTVAVEGATAPCPLCQRDSTRASGGRLPTSPLVAGRSRSWPMSGASGA